METKNELPSISQNFLLIPLVVGFYYTSFLGTRYGFELVETLLFVEAMLFLLFFLIFIGIVALVALFLPLFIQYILIKPFYVNLAWTYILPIGSFIGFYEAVSRVVANISTEFDDVSVLRIILLVFPSTLIIFASAYAPSWMLNLVWHRRNEVMREEQYLYILGFVEMIAVLVIYHFAREIAISGVV
jgi:hypothetical protein